MELSEIQAELDKRDAAIEANLEALKTASGDAVANIKADLAAQAESGMKLHAALIEVSQKMADQIGAFGGPGNEPKSFSTAAIESDGFKAVMEGKAKTGRYTVNGSWHTAGATVIGSGTTGTGNGGNLLTPDYRPGLIMQPDMPLLIRDLLMPGQTDKQVIQYWREVGFTNAADWVTENTRKPQSDVEFEFAEANVRTLAHFVKATNQILSDVPQLRSYIDFRLRWGIKDVENAALLNGSGTGQSIEGLNTVATPYDDSANKSGDTMIDILSHAYTQAELAYYPADWTILHPRDWEAITLQKDGEGRYIWANPGSVLGKQIWGRRVVTTAAQEEGTFTVGARMASQIFDREDITVQIATENEDDFVNNRVTVLAEERLAVCHYRPEAIIMGEF